MSCSASRADRAQPVAQVVLDVGLQVGDAVVERDLPARRALLELVGAGLGLGAARRPARRAARGSSWTGELGLHARRRAARPPTARPGWWSAGPGRRTGPRPCAAGSRPARWKPDSSISVGVLRPAPRAAAASRTPGRSRRRMPALREVAAVELHDPPPVRVEVGLGEHARDVGAQLHRRVQELQLGAGVLLGGVGDQQHRVGAGQRRHRGRAVRRAEPADARGVDEHQPAGQQLARQPDLGVGRAAPCCPGCRPRRRTRRAGSAGTAVRSAASPSARPRAPASTVVVSACLTTVGTAVAMSSSTGHTGRVDQRVDQLALALLELADDQHPHVGVGQPLAGLACSRAAEVGPLVGGGRLQREVDQVDRCRYRHARPSLLVDTCWPSARS